MKVDLLCYFINLSNNIISLSYLETSPKVGNKVLRTDYSKIILQLFLRGISFLNMF